MKLLVIAPAGRAAERRYVLDVVLSEWLGLDYQLVVGTNPRVAIRVVGDPRDRELTVPDVLFAVPSSAWLAQESMPILPLRLLETRATELCGGANAGPMAAQSIPVLYGDATESRLVWTPTATGISLAVDVFGAVFFLISRYEEIVKQDRDQHGRFPAGASVATHSGFVERPLADEYVDLLWNAMLVLWPSLSRRQSHFRLRLTHDVDQPWAALGQGVRAVAHASAGDILRRRDPVLAARRIRALYEARATRVDRDPYNVFSFLMDTSERHGLTSVFYFLAGNSPADFDYRYQLSDQPMLDLLRSIHERGHEIGLHASYLSHRSARRTDAEFAALRAACRTAGFEQPTYGVRQHYLRLANPDTWQIQEAAGFEHDSTLAFAEQVGFRAGTCREYPLFDLVRRKRLRLRERPLVVMDATLLEYLGLRLSEASARARAIVQTCRRQAGDAVVLYHNSSLAGKGRREHYRDLVDEIMG